MRDVIVVDIDAPQNDVADLFADPKFHTMWMGDVARYEPVSGKQGMTGSKYRLIPKRGSLLFTATVVERKLPSAVRVKLDSATVIVDIRGTLSPLPGGRTRLRSEETFRFKTAWQATIGYLKRPAIHRTHRRNLEAFKRFAEHHH